jgi:hypothetical protein
MKVQDTLAFVEDGDFLAEFRECGLDDDDLEDLQIVITVFPEDAGDVVPVSTNIRDAIYVKGDGDTVVVRYVHLKPSTVLLLAAYLGDKSLPMTDEEAAEAEIHVRHQTDYFANRFTR